ncbi:hypothetical protein ACKWMY_27790 [Serratia sp. J2]|uniref:hypothetical protein n=1 Tax=Serratia sp. J2 TaxID=3386551 RepID=UPI0039170CCA
MLLEPGYFVQKLISLILNGGLILFTHGAVCRITDKLNPAANQCCGFLSIFEVKLNGTKPIFEQIHKQSPESPENRPAPRNGHKSWRWQVAGVIFLSELVNDMV